MACSQNSPASIPIAASAPSLKLTDEIAEDEHDGVGGLFITWKGYEAHELSHEREKGALRLRIAGLETTAEISKAMLDAYRKSAARVQWLATYAPWLGFAGGLTLAGVVAGVIYAIVNGVRAAWSQMQGAQR